MLGPLPDLRRPSACQFVKLYHFPGAATVYELLLVLSRAPTAASASSHLCRSAFPATVLFTFHNGRPKLPPHIIQAEHSSHVLHLCSGHARRQARILQDMKIKLLLARFGARRRLQPEIAMTFFLPHSTTVALPCCHRLASPYLGVSGSPANLPSSWKFRKPRALNPVAYAPHSLPDPCHPRY